MPPEANLANSECKHERGFMGWGKGRQDLACDGE